jgi:hypothetical protein
MPVRLDDPFICLSYALKAIKQCIYTLNIVDVQVAIDNDVIIPGREMRKPNLNP